MRACIEFLLIELCILKVMMLLENERTEISIMNTYTVYHISEYIN